MKYANKDTWNVDKEVPRDSGISVSWTSEIFAGTRPPWAGTSRHSHKEEWKSVGCMRYVPAIGREVCTFREEFHFSLFVLPWFSASDSNYQSLRLALPSRKAQTATNDFYDYTRSPYLRYDCELEIWSKNYELRGITQRMCAVVGECLRVRLSRARDDLSMSRRRRPTAIYEWSESRLYAINICWDNSPRLFV